MFVPVDLSGPGSSLPIHVPATGDQDPRRGIEEGHPLSGSSHRKVGPPRSPEIPGVKKSRKDPSDDPLVEGPCPETRSLVLTKTPGTVVESMNQYVFTQSTLNPTLYPDTGEVHVSLKKGYDSISRGTQDEL